MVISVLLIFLTLAFSNILPDQSHPYPISPSSPNAQESNVDYWFYISIDNRISKGDYLNIIFPSAFTDITMGGVTTCFINDVSHSCARADSKQARITASQVIPGNSRLKVKIPGITNPTGEVGTGWFQISSQYAVGGQIIDSNDAFGVIGFAPAVSSVTGTIAIDSTGGTSVVAVSSNYIFTITLSTAIAAGTQFRVKIPSLYSITSSTTCAVVTTTTLLGTFSCSKVSGNLVISGLTSTVASGTVVTIKVSGILNPSYVITAGTVHFIIETLRENTSIVIHRASISNILGVAGTLTGISLAPFTTNSKFTNGNSLYTTLTFTTATKIPEGGSIALEYDATIDSSSCLVLSGVPNTSSGTRPSCSITGSTVTISNFGVIAAKTTIKIVNWVTNLSASIGEVQISTYYSGSNLIDQDLTHGGITMESIYSFNSGSSVTYSTTALDKGKITIDLDPYYNVAANDVINIYLPTNFTIASTQTYTCRIYITSSWLLPAAFSVVNGIFSITAGASTAFSTGSATAIELGASGSGIQFPPNATSNSNIIEWVIGVTHSASSELGTLQSSLDEAPFVLGSGHTELIYSQEISTFSAYSFKIQTDLDLWSSGNRKFMLSLTFPSDYTSDLGTDLSSSGSIPIYLSSFTTTNYTTPLSCILTPGTNPTIVISGFDPIKAGTIISFTFFIENPSSAGTDNIKVQTYYTDYNSIITICQQGNIAVTYAPSSAAWSTMTVTTRNTTVVSTSTWFILDLLLSSASVTNDYLMINFPADFTIDTKNFVAKIDGTEVDKYVIYANSYAPSIVLSLETIIINGSPSDPNELILEGVINAPYVGSGSGDIGVGLIDGTSHQLTSYSTEALSAITSDTLKVTVIPNSYIAAHCDVTYKFSITATHGIPSTGTIQITFPVGFDLTDSSCSYSYSISSADACTISGQVISVDGFNAIASGTSFNVNVLSVKNPNAGASGAFTVTTTYTSTTSTVIETKTVSGFTLTSSTSQEYSNIYQIAFYPNTSGTKGQMQLDFALNSSVPTQGDLIIEFPSSFSSLPSTLTNLNCLLNVQYHSCSISGQTITVTPATSFPTGINMTLIIPEITVPGTSTTPVKISAVLDSTIMAENPPSPGSSFYITTGTVTAGIIQGTLTAWPKNAAEIAFYQFVLKSATGITTTTQILVYFPPEFPRNLGDLMVYSNCSARMDGRLLVVSRSMIHGVLIQGFVAVASNQPFTVLFEGVRNPTSSTSTSSFSIVTLYNGAIIDSLSTYLTVSISSIPSIMDLVNIDLDDYSIRATTSYTFLASPSYIPSAFQIWAWFPFPQFSIELYGLGDTFECSSKSVSKSSGASTTWLSGTPSCSNMHKNLVVFEATGASFSSSNYLQVTIEDLKSTGSAGVVNNFVLMIFDKNSLSVTYRNYGIASTVDYVEYLEDKAQIFVGSQDARISVSPGTTSNFTIYTSSDYMPARQTLTFTYTILGTNATAHIGIEPNIIQIAQGESSVACFVTCSADIIRGNYTIKWNMTGDTYKLYSEPEFTLLDVSSRRIVQRKVSFEGIPTLMIGGTSIPLYVYLEAAPEDGLTIIAETPSLITASAISFLPGQFVTSFTVTVDSSAYVGSQTINFTLSGANSNWFYLESSSITFDLTNYDVTAPAISSFIVNNPKNRNYIDITMQTTEACTIYWTFGERGLDTPSNDTLIGSAINKTSGYHLEYIGDSWLYNFRVSNLIAEHDYVMYGILVDLNKNAMDSVFSVDLYTDDLPDSVQITIKFGSLAPTADQAQSTVIVALSTLLDYDQSLIVYVQPTSRMLDTLTSASYIIYNSATSTALAPQEIVRYMLNPNDLNRLLSASSISIDLTYNIVKSMTYISNPRPIWYTYPTVKTTTNTTVSVTLAVTASGTLYAEVIPDGDEIPSSRQVTLGLDAFADKATVYSQAIVANTSVTISFTGMTPASSYTIVITAKNNDSRLPRIMSDRVMAALEIITQATSVTSSTTSEGIYLLISCMLSLFL